MFVYPGRTATLAGYFESAFRTPGATPQGQLLKFSTMNPGQEAVLEENPTIQANALTDKRTEMDSSASMELSAILCLNDIGWWLKALLGSPTTTGTGTYTHTFTLNLNDRPSLAFEATVTANAVVRYHRFIGMMLNQLSWDALANNQSFSASLIGAVEVKPRPTAPLDASLTPRFATRRACTKRANVYDVSGSNTLGRLNQTTIQWSNDLTGYPLADGQEGFGAILLGQPAVSGTLGGLFEDATLFDHAWGNVSKTLVIDQADETGNATMKVTIPNIEFDRPKLNVNTSKGLVVEGVNWRAHYAAGANPVTVVLVNDVPSYP
ncbi:phage tail tube protein [Nevskia sp.]|uniref:phage tail tube protein n=1 Tax=Nevskia sp. TaxID=1929292 RepID=UPI0025E0BBFA|nr:phage tail tube protein [Nevskia sp.]